MYIKVYFKSFYKFSRHHHNNPKRDKKNPSNAAIQPAYEFGNYNYVTFFFLLFHIKSCVATNVPICLKCTYLPKKKNMVIFLRAPYKNKLARLNIVRVQSSLIISAQIGVSPELRVNFNRAWLQRYLDFFCSLRLGAAKSEHLKTRWSVDLTNVNNFMLGHFIG